MPHRRTSQQVAAIIERSTVADGDCRIWSGVINAEGYGSLTWKGDDGVTWSGAHRVSFRIYRGPIEPGLHLDHLCRVRSCVNPDHLEPVTSRTNTFRSPIATAAVNAAKTHCPSGHAYDETNTGRRKNGWRYCRSCLRKREVAR